MKGFQTFGIPYIYIGLFPLPQTVLMVYNIFGTLCKPQCLDHKAQVLQKPVSVARLEDLNAGRGHELKTTSGHERLGQSSTVAVSI
jgi:hypothetical protein